MFLWVSELCASKAIQTGVGTEHSSNLQHKPRKKSWCPHPEPSSWTLCGSYLSSVSSGNHSRSDPVQVQSTPPIKSNFNQYIMTFGSTSEWDSHTKWRHFSELQIFSQSAAAQVHPQCHSNICDCCSLRWIQRQWFSALSQAHAYSCGWHCESNIFGADPATPPVMVISIYGCTIVWQHGFMDTRKHGYTDTQIHRYTDTRMHGYMDAWMHGCMDTCMMYDICMM